MSQTVEELGKILLNEYVELLREFGFPVFMVLWFMFRTEKVIEENTKALIALGEFINKKDGD